MNIRWGDFPVSGSWVVRAIYAACGLIVVLFAASIFLVLDYSVEQANEFGMLTERKLVQREFQRQIDQVVRYQADTSFSNETFDEVRKGAFSQRFVERELTEGLWNNYGFSWLIFTDRGHNSRLVMKNGEVVAGDDADKVLFWIDDLVDEAAQAYQSVLRPMIGGHIIAMRPNDRDMLAAPVPQIHAADMRMVDGRMSIVVVQAVIPHNLFIPAAAIEPTLLVTVKPVSAKMLKAMNERLAIGGLSIMDSDAPQKSDLAFTPVGKGFTDGPFVVSWKPNAPGPFIRAAATPKLLILAALAAAAMGFIGWRFGALVRALQRSEASNRFFAKHDALTGLANRAHFEERMRLLTETPERAPFALIALDLDRFKAVNDRYGHAAGDAVLCALAARFRNRIGERGFVARLGGDEFMVYLKGDVPRDELMGIANGLVIDAQVPVQFGTLLLTVGGSAGVALFPEHGDNIRVVFHSADVALYAAKNGGRNRAVLFEPKTMADSGETAGGVAA